MKLCELCKAKARILCESDQASLCWNCDARVHSANFLVARHSRNLLCHVCQSPTPWAASGTKLRRTFAVCEQCVVDGRKGAGEEEENAEAGREEVVEENQVVPWSPPPAPESSTSIDDLVTNGRDAAGLSRKRYRIEIASSDILHTDDLSCTSSQPHISGPATPLPDSTVNEDSFPSLLPHKTQTTDSDQGSTAETRTRILDSQRILH